MAAAQYRDALRLITRHDPPRASAGDQRRGGGALSETNPEDHGWY